MYHQVHPRGIVLAGPCIVGAAASVADLMINGTHVHVVFTDDPPAEHIEAYAGETSLSLHEEDKTFFMNDYRNVAPNFRSLLASSIAAGNYNEQIDVFRQRDIPLLVVFGADEKIVKPDYLDNVDLPLWRSKVHRVDGASHLVNVDQPQLFNQLLASYAEEMFR